MDVTVFVENLPLDLTTAELEELFAPFGPVHVIMARDRSRALNSFGLVVCYTPAAAEQAIQALNDAELMGRRIHVRAIPASDPTMHAA
jgi:RNA recognition motif-containing protein